MRPPNSRRRPPPPPLRYDAGHRAPGHPPMKQTFLDFELPIAELQQKIDELRYVHEDSAVDISDEIARLTKKSQQLAKDIYGMNQTGLGWLTKQRSAAWPKWRASATATTYFSSVSVIGGAYYKYFHKVLE